jgi:hypothetical protein
MPTAPGATQPEDEALLLEQTQIQQIEGDGTSAPEIEQEPAPTPAPAKDEQEKPSDPRADRLEQLANRAHENRREEAEAVAEVMVPSVQAEPEPPAPAPERMIKLKVRGEIVELPESEVIARAQKVDAADDYLRESRELLEDAKRTVRQPEPATVQEPKPEKVNRIALAMEQLQNGADPSEVEKLLDQEIAERIDGKLTETQQRTEIEQAVSSFDAEVEEGYIAVKTDYPELAKDIVATNVVVSLAGGMEAEVIGRYLDSATPQIKSAFAQAGITAEGVRRYAPHDAHALFKDMHLKGFPLPPPAAVIRAAGKTVAEWKPGNTPPVPAPTPAAPNRTARKEAIQQPERASIPRTPPGNPAPQSETSRATAARNELRAARRGARG